jgi:hypothetical protein
MAGTSLQGYANPELMILEYVRQETGRKQVTHSLAGDMSWPRQYRINMGIDGHAELPKAMASGH